MAELGFFGIIVDTIYGSRGGDYISLCNYNAGNFKS